MRERQCEGSEGMGRLEKIWKLIKEYPAARSAWNVFDTQAVTYGSETAALVTYKGQN